MKEIGVCIAGFGNFGRKLFSYLEKMPEFEVRYLYHPNFETAAGYGPRGINQLEIALDDPLIDAFVIATPHDEHFRLLEKLAHRKSHHIFVEKPMTALYSGALSLSEHVLSSARVFMVGHNQRREAVFRKAKELLDQRIIGRVVDVHFNFSHGGVYNIDQNSWRASRGRNRRGPLDLLGSHAIDTIHYLFGEIHSVLASSLGNISQKTKAPDCASVLLHLENGANVFLSSNYCVPSEKYCFISGTEGAIYIDRDKIYLRLGRDANRVPTQREEISVSPVDTILEELQEFADAILKGKKVETGFHEGLAVMKVLGAC